MLHDLSPPYGYYNILFCTGEGEFFLAKNLADAKKRDKTAEPTLYFDLINSFSHVQVAKFLKNIGDSWITRGGIFFFKGI